MLQSWWLLILLPLAAFSGWLIARHGSQGGKQVPKSLKNLPSAYYRGLNFLLNEQSDNAIDAFQSAIDEQGDSLEVQLALGNVYRRRGEIEKATHLHQNLISQTRHDPQLHALALYELAQDYQKAGLLDRAETLFLELAGSDFQRRAACAHLLQIFEHEKDWEDAISVIDRFSGGLDESWQLQKSHYYCELAETPIQEERYGDAQALVQQALSSKPDNLRAIIQSGRLKAANGDHRAALALWQQVIDRDSLFIREVLELVVNSFHALDDPQGLNTYLANLIEQYNSSRAVLLLTENLANKSGPAHAEAQLAGWLRKNPSLSGVRKLLDMKIAGEGLTATNRRDLFLLSKLLDSVIKAQSSYQCRQCGFSGNNFYWQCPSCRTWSSISAQRRVLEHDQASEEPGFS